MIGSAFIKHLGLIGELSEQDETDLRGLKGEERHIGRDQDILREGDRPTHVIVVLSGLLQRYKVTASGQRQIQSFYFPTDTPCLETLHIGRMGNSLSAVVDSKIGVIPHSELFRLMASNPNLIALFWRETLCQGSTFLEWMLRNSQLVGHARLAHLFCEAVARLNASGIARGQSCKFPVSQANIADAVGMTTVHVNRSLQALRETDFVEFRKSLLTVTNFDKLAEIADFNPNYLHYLPEG